VRIDLVPDVFGAGVRFFGHYAGSPLLLHDPQVVQGDRVTHLHYSVRKYANNPIEADHGQLKRRLRPMRGLQSDRTAQVVIAGRAFLQNLRRGHYELEGDARPELRIAAVFTELAQAI
jgi:hypothetical protein